MVVIFYIYIGFIYFYNENIFYVSFSDFKKKNNNLLLQHNIIN
jgi:hypothetical protein